MKTTRDFIEALRKKHGGCSYYRISKILDVSDTAVHRWKDGKGGLARDVALKVADELGLPHAYVLACIEGEREQSPEVVPVWEAIAKRFAGKAASVLLAGTAMLAHVDDAKSAGIIMVSDHSPATQEVREHCILC